MPVDDAVLRAARNAFMFVLLALLAVSIYQFVVLGGLAWEVGVIWVVGVGAYYGSKWYYGRRDDTAGAPATETGEND